MSVAPRPIKSAKCCCWSEYSHTLPPATIGESAKWIKTTKAAPNCSMTMPIDPVDISTLNTEQSIAYNIIQRHCHNLTANQHSITPLKNDCMWYSCNRQIILNKCHCSVPRRQSYCIRNNRNGWYGATIHSIVQLPIRSCNKKDLQGLALQRLQKTFRDEHYQLIDEMSMLGQMTFAWIDKRVR